MSLLDLQAKIAKRFGLARRPFAEDLLLRAAEQLARRLQVPLLHLIERLEGDAELSRDLAGHFTVDETYFLRHPEHFEVILERIKAAAPRQPSERPFTVWSAGCAHGEEPFSVAILLAERAPWALPVVRIVASDLSLQSLQQARAGCYSDWSLRDVPEQIRSRYFTRAEAGWQLSPSVRSQVRFEHLSVLEHLAALPDRSVDVLLFRNVAIYLEPASLERVYQGFSRVLAQDGLLVLSASDPPPSRELFALSETCASTYHLATAKKPAHPAARKPVGATAAPLPIPRAPAARPAPAKAPKASKPAEPLHLGPARVPAGSMRARGQDLYELAVKLGNQGASQVALETAAKVIETAPDWSAGYVLRATLLLAASRHSEALSDLRHAAYLAPDDLLPRFLRATTLRAAQQLPQARAEARDLAERLRQLPDSAVLEDGRTTAGELLGAALELAEEGK